MCGMGFWGRPVDQEDSPGESTGLHGATHHRCVEITLALSEMNNWDVQAADLDGNAAIAWAARNG